MTKTRKKFKFKNLFIFLINIALIVSSILLITNVIKLKGIEDTIRYVGCGVYALIIIIISVINLKNSIKNKKIKLFLSIVLSFIFLFINLFLVYNANKIFNILNKISRNDQTVSISLVTLKSNKVTILDEISNSDNIAGISEELSKEFSSLINEYVKQNVIKNKIVKYDNYLDIVNDLNKNKIKYAFLPSEYSSLFPSDDTVSLDNIKVLDKYSKSKKIEYTSQKKLTSPFTVLLMGVDTLTTAYNADTLMVVTFNPNTLNATVLSIPRDTYTTIACTGKKNKINSSGLYGDDCVIKTVKNYLDVDIDYYFKVNFKGLVNIVDLIGGIEVDVPYSFCEQNSRRKWGKNTIYVEKGLHTLNGEQALALSRNRHYWPGKCSSKYTKEGTRSDFTRGQNQQLVFKSILNKGKTIRSIDTIYKLLDTLGNNMVTNMSTDTILSVYNIGKNIINKMNYQDRDISQILYIQRLKFTSTTQRIQVGSYNMDMVINSDSSLDAISNEMKVNLGLKKATLVKTFEFDINEPYEEKIVGVGLSSYTKTVSTLPNFVGKRYSYVNNWTKANGIKLKYEYVESSKYSNDTVISQSIKANTDISNIYVLSVKIAKTVTKVDKTPKTDDSTSSSNQQIQDQNDNKEEENNNNSTEQQKKIAQNKKTKI